MAFFYAQHCTLCDTEITGEGLICPRCYVTLPHIGQHYCAQCGIPFNLPVGHGARCASCIRQAPPYRQARALFLYEDPIREMILLLKYGDQHYYAPYFAGLMAHKLSLFDCVFDYLIPVPTHSQKLWQRLYNQTALLAHALSKKTAIPALMRALVRRDRQTQKYASRLQRFAQLKKAFYCPPIMHPFIKDTHLLLIDDVMTTGATATHCSDALLSSGAASVSVLSIARVGLQAMGKEAAINF